MRVPGLGARLGLAYDRVEMLEVASQACLEVSMTPATVPESFVDRLLLNVSHAKLTVTPEHFDQLCIDNPDLRLELTKDGELIVIAPAATVYTQVALIPFSPSPKRGEGESEPADDRIRFPISCGLLCTHISDKVSTYCEIPLNPP